MELGMGRGKEGVRGTGGITMPVPPQFGLEVQLERHLNDAWRAKPRDLAECRTGDAGYGIVPVAMIHDVKEVGTEVEPDAFFDLKWPAKGRVKLNASRSEKGIAPEIAEEA